VLDLSRMTIRHCARSSLAGSGACYTRSRYFLS
jgi:hypothetical protein